MSIWNRWTYLSKPVKWTIILTLACAVFFTIGRCSASAEPWLVSDPQAGVTHHRVTISGASAIVQPAQPDGSLRYDLGSLSNGTWAGTVESGVEYVLNGTPQGVWDWSDPLPFDLSGGSVGDTSGLRVTQ